MRYSVKSSIVLINLVFLLGCQPLKINSIADRLTPSNERNWTPELIVLPSAKQIGNQIEIKNIRNINYISDDDFVIKHYDRTINLSDIQNVDFVVTPFNNMPAIAHTMLSFGLADGTYLGLSVEIRNEFEEDYSPFLGISNQFEITYVLADEKDLIRVRTRHRNSDVYVYPTVATAEQAQSLFVNVMQRVNQLQTSPEFYNTLYNNCTTNLVDHVNQLKTDRVRFSWRVLLPGFSAKYAYDLGLLDNRIPFEDLKNTAYVNDLVDKYYNSSEFSMNIRERRKNIERLAAQIQIRDRNRNTVGQDLMQR
ncbi:MAG: DUF4105 domain-containing protein [Planctomycetota bacterium]